MISTAVFKGRATAGTTVAKAVAETTHTAAPADACRHCVRCSTGYCLLNVFYASNRKYVLYCKKKLAGYRRQLLLPQTWPLSRPTRATPVANAVINLPLLHIQYSYPPRLEQLALHFRRCWPRLTAPAANERQYCRY